MIVLAEILAVSPNKIGLVTNILPPTTKHMKTRITAFCIVAFIACGSSAISTASAGEGSHASTGEPSQDIALKGVKGRIPANWHLLASKADQVTLLAADGSTVVSIRSAEANSPIDENMFAGFARTQLVRAKQASKGEVKSIPIQLPEFVFYGGPKENGHVFAGYLHSSGRILTLIEADMAAKDPKLAMKLVSDFVQNLNF